MADFAGTRLDRDEGYAVAALSFILGATLLWWAFALWPTEPASNAWLLRAREVCFGSTESGLPNAGGWLLLIGQPIGMIGVLAVGWRKSLFGGLDKLDATRHGRTVIAGALIGLAGSLGLTGWRVQEARAASAVDLDDTLVGTAEQLDEAPPRLSLLDHRGDRFTTDDLEGRPTFVTFAFGHCETVCPLVVEVARRAQERLADSAPVRLVVITVDPWRDRPERLSSLAEKWHLAEDAHVLSGPIDDVNRVLDDFGVSRQRNHRTGEIVHSSRVVLIDGSGRMRLRAPADLNALVEAVRAL